MPNVLAINFTSQPNASESISFDVMVGDSVFGITENFQDEIDDPNEVLIGSSLSETIQNLSDSLGSDYAGWFESNISGNSIYIFSINGYSISNVDIDGEFATYSLQDISFAVSGLGKDRYLINNEILIKFSSGTFPQWYDLLFENQQNQKSRSARIYPNPNDGTGQMYISGTLKSLFEYPSDSPNYIFHDQPIANSNIFSITVSAEGIDPVTLVKTFVRGGKKTNDTNQSLSVSERLRPTPKLPIWQGYDSADYVFQDGQIIKQLLADVPSQYKDLQRKKGCNEVYVKFLNQKGGYCHWLFGSHERSVTGQSDGIFVRDNRIEDLGGDSSAKIKLFGKIPEYYKGYIDDLVVSPEVYVLEGGKFVRVSMASNTFVYDEIQRAYNVKVNMEYAYRRNTSLLWSS